MLRPDDLIPDEKEYPGQTRMLQQHYAPSAEDQRSLLRLRTRLHERRAALAHEQLEPPAAGQVLQPPPLVGRKRTHVSFWRLAALVAVLGGLVLGGLWYGLAHRPAQISQPHPFRITPTIIPRQNVELHDLKMTSATTGWAVDIYGPPVWPATIIRTIDGGKSWQPFDFHGQAAGPMGAFFLDDRTAWVTMGSSFDAHTRVTVMHTTDGGRHWAPLHLPLGMLHYTFIDQQHGWAWAQDALPHIPYLSLYTTVDGGATWIKLGTMNSARSFDDPTPGPLPFSEVMDLTFLTPQEGWAILYPAASPRALIYRTQNGGTTWQLQRLPLPATGPIPGIHTAIPGNARSVYLTLSEPAFLTPQHGLLTIESQASRQQPIELYVYETTDGGQDWSPLGAPIEVGSQAALSAILDATHLLLATRGRYRLVQGHWQQQTLWTLAGQVLSLSFVNARLGWAYVGQLTDNQVIRTLYKTSDGGASWQAVMQSVITEPLNQQGG